MQLSLNLCCNGLQNSCVTIPVDFVSNHKSVHGLVPERLSLCSVSIHAVDFPFNHSVLTTVEKYLYNCLSQSIQDLTCFSSLLHVKNSKPFLFPLLLIFNLITSVSLNVIKSPFLQ